MLPSTYIRRLPDNNLFTKKVNNTFELTFWEITAVWELFTPVKHAAVTNYSEIDDANILKIVYLSWKQKPGTVDELVKALQPTIQYI